MFLHKIVTVLWPVFFYYSTFFTSQNPTDHNHTKRPKSHHVWFYTKCYLDHLSSPVLHKFSLKYTPTKTQAISMQIQPICKRLRFRTSLLLSCHTNFIDRQVRCPCHRNFLPSFILCHWNDNNRIIILTLTCTKFILLFLDVGILSKSKVQVQSLT